MSTEESRKKAREYQRAYDPARKRLYNRRRYQKMVNNGTWDVFWHAHWLVLKALKNGKLLKEACAICDEPKVEAHHEDYSEPLDVIWLCNYHHKNIEKIKAAILLDLKPTR